MISQLIKSTGDIEDYNEKKLAESLRRAGASKPLISRTLYAVRPSGNRKITTDMLYRRVFQTLWREDRAIAEKYSLKRAIMNLGPAGHVFESFIARIFESHGYETRVSQIVQGKCVSHEVDVLARKGNKHYMIECKYHNKGNIRSDVKVVLYTQSRFLDIQSVWERNELQGDIHQGWLATNTRPTSEAVAYAKCVGIRVIAWRYPEGAGLEYFIESKRLYPITVLPSFPVSLVERAMKDRILLVSDLANWDERALSRALMIEFRLARKILQEARELGIKS